VIGPVAARTEISARDCSACWPANDKLWGRLARIAANHLVVIRSFLIESDAFRRSRATICAKNFRHVGGRASSVVNAKCSNQHVQILFLIVRRTNYRRYRNPYFIVFFCNHDDARMNLVARRVRAPTMTTVAAQMRRRVSQVARVHVSLGVNAVFFAVL
jgi:hypothetical protein